MLLGGLIFSCSDILLVRYFSEGGFYGVGYAGVRWGWVCGDESGGCRNVVGGIMIAGI